MMAKHACLHKSSWARFVLTELEGAIRVASLGCLLAASWGCTADIVESSLSSSEQANTESTASISGIVFEDLDRNGSWDPSEPPWPGHGVSVFDENGDLAGHATSAEDGTWTISGLAPGSYQAKMSSATWFDIFEQWAPTTTETIFPRKSFDLSAGASETFDLGWHAITVSTDINSPISVAETSDGVVVEVFNDALPAQEIVDALERGTLRGQEAPLTKVLFAYSTRTYCTHTVSGVPGTHSNFQATCYIGLKYHLTNEDFGLFHEYGHAWATYHQKVVNQWENLEPYLIARGVDTQDERLFTSHAWTPSEMIAEDFRQLFSSPAGASRTQENPDIPFAADVEGLKTWLSTTFVQGDEAWSNQLPVAAFTGSCTGSDCVFDASDSHDPDGTITAYEWRFGDGSTATGMTVSHSYAWAGDFAVSLLVRDDDGGATLDTKHFLIQEGGGTSGSGPEISDVQTLTFANGSSWTAWLLVSVREGTGASAGQLVEANWFGEGRHGGQGTRSCTTAANGQCNLIVELAKKVSGVTFELTSPSTQSVYVPKP